MQFALRGDPPSAAAARPHGMTVSNKSRIEVLPVLFIPSDATWVTQRDIDLYSYLVFAHLELVQQHYKAVLKTDTFKISSERCFVYRAQHEDTYYMGRISNSAPDSASLWLRILRARHQDRYSSNNIFVIVYVHAHTEDSAVMRIRRRSDLQRRPEYRWRFAGLELTADVR